jgi:hypothetical protein
MMPPHEPPEDGDYHAPVAGHERLGIDQCETSEHRQQARQYIIMLPNS